MDISFDPVKRKRTLLERELDFIDAIEVFEGSEFTRVDSRSDYGEVRCVTYGLLKGRVICVVWTQRGRNPPYYFDEESQ